MHENRNLFLFLIEINNMHHTRHILPIPRTCIWRRCGVSWHRCSTAAPMKGTSAFYSRQYFIQYWVVLLIDKDQ